MRARLQQFLLFGTILITTGFMNPSFLLRRATPTVDTDVPNTITSTTAISGGLNVTDGGGNVTRKGVVYDLASNPIPDISDSFTDEGTGTGDYISSITGLTAETEYRVRAYVENDDPDIGYGLPETFWTLSTQPTGAVNAMATTVNAVAIDLSFEDLMNLTDADGYFILRSTVSTPTLVNGQLPGGDLIHTETNTGVTTFNDTGLDPNTTYYYLIAPFNFNGTDTETYHYQITGNDVSATTDPPSNASTLVAAGNEAGNMAYINFQSGNINSTAQGVRVWSITITDAGGADDDGLPTIIDDITFIEGPSNSADFSGTLRAIALFEGATEIGDGSFSGDNLVFTGLNFVVPQSGSRTLDLYVSFDNTVTDGQQLHIEVGSVGLGSPSSTGTLGTVQSTHTAGVTNRVDVVATELEFQSPPTTVIDETNFSMTVRAVDANGSVDIDNSASVTLSSTPDAITSATGFPQNLSNGVYTWSDLQIDVSAQTVNTVSAENAGLTNANTPVTVRVPGVIVTPANTIEFCAQGQVITLSDIVLTEGVADDFGQDPPGQRQEYVIRLPDGYEFDGSASSVNVTETGPGSSDITGFSGKFIVGRFFVFDYNVSGTSNLDEITINNLRVEKTGSGTSSGLEIERVNGNNSSGEVQAIQNGNAATDQVHGLIDFGGIQNATLEQDGGTNTICVGDMVSFTASGGDDYEFFITPDGGSPVSRQSGASANFVTTELEDMDVVSVLVTNSVTGCNQTVSLPPMQAFDQPFATITQPVDGAILIQGSDPLDLIAQDSVGGATTNNAGLFSGEHVQDNGGGSFSFNPVALGVFPITYTFITPDGCTAIDQVTVQVQPAGSGGKVVDLEDQYCNTDPADGLAFLLGAPWSVTNITGPGIVGSAPNYSFDPRLVGTVGNKTIFITIEAQIQTSPGFPPFIPPTFQTITLRFPQSTIVFGTPNVSFDIPIQPYYCEDETILAKGNFPGGEFRVEGPNVIGSPRIETANGDGEFIFDITGDGLGVGPVDISYTFADPVNGGCENTVTESFEILPVPPTATSVNVPDSVFFCIGDQILPLTGVSDDPNDFTLAWFDEAFDPIPLDTGLVFDISFIDSLSSSVNVFYVANAHKVYTDCEGGRKPVVVTVGVIPEANFQVTGLCRSDVTNFQDLSTISQGSIDSWLWDFGDGNMSTLQNPTHSYPGPGTYTVSLTARSERNCEDTYTRLVTIYPEIEASNFPYFETFNAGANGWSAQSLELSPGVLAPNTWSLETPNGTKIDPLDLDSWITNNGSINSTSYDPDEQSWVECPCLDLSSLDRPMISFDLWTDSEFGVDGAVLQITTDDGLTWYEVGDDITGVNWYDSRGLPGNPGQQNGSNFGWTGVEQEWRTAKYALSQFLDSLDASSRVRLRIAFGSNNSDPGGANFSGIGFDNVFIGNRNRKVLIEHFTNTNNPDYATENSDYNDFINARPNELINIRYHTDFPDPDDLYLSNPSIPGARALFYGISEVSNNSIDGTFNPDPLNNWGDVFFEERTLDAAPYQILFEFDPPGEELEVRVILNTDQTIAAREDTFDLYVAVVETFPDMSNVVRQMMPDVSGTRVNWSVADTTRTFEFSQKLTNIDNTANVSVVAFLQAASIQELPSKEILQAEDSIPPVVPSIVTGIDDELLENLEVSLYPNPTQGLLNVSFNKPLAKDTQWEVYNTFGQMTASGEFVRGSTLVVLSESNFAQGVYLLKLQTADNSFLIRKFMVVR